jgi:type IV pilus assembly protein PilE
MRRAAGFTLIELLVVVAIVGILARIAIPGYTRYIQRGDLVEGTQALAQYRVVQEQFYQDNHTYAAAGGGCGTGFPTMVNFAMACATSAGGQAYTATVTGANAIAGFVYTINQANTQATTGLPSSWGTLTSAASTTWIVR